MTDERNIEMGRRGEEESIDNYKRKEIKKEGNKGRGIR